MQWGTVVIAPDVNSLSASGAATPDFQYTSRHSILSVTIPDLFTLKTDEVLAHRWKIIRLSKLSN